MSEQVKDKFKAVWVSHSSMNDFLKCPRLYYLRNVYKDIKTGNKFTVMTPPLALGQAVHEVVEQLSTLEQAKRFSVSPLLKFEKVWEKVTGELGGFKNKENEEEYKARGVKMLQNIIDNPGPVMRKALKLKSENGLSSYWFSDTENIILCGKVDWIEYVDTDDSIHIIDFKTGKNEEDESSLQLPIYLLLASNLQKRNITKASYWYLDKDRELKTIQMPSLTESADNIGKIAGRIKLARQLNHFVCKTNGCRHCYPFERVLKGEGRKVGVSEYRQDIYVLNN